MNHFYSVYTEEDFIEEQRRTRIAKAAIKVLCWFVIGFSVPFPFAVVYLAGGF